MENNCKTEWMAYTDHMLILMSVLSLSSRICLPYGPALASAPLSSFLPQSPGQVSLCPYFPHPSACNLF